MRAKFNLLINRLFKSCPELIVQSAKFLGQHAVALLAAQLVFWNLSAALLWRTLERYGKDFRPASSKKVPSVEKSLVTTACGCSAIVASISELRSLHGTRTSRGRRRQEEWMTSKGTYL